MTQSALWSFEGRASRSKFWLVFLLSIFVSFVVILFTLLATPALMIMGTFSPTVASIVSILLYILMIPMWWISIATSVKRFHDRGKSGWWYLIVLVPFLGALWLIIENGFLKGTTGTNNFGEDPLANSSVLQASSMASPSFSHVPTSSGPSFLKLSLLIIGGAIIVLVLGRVIWAYQQVKSDEAKAQNDLLIPSSFSVTFKPFDKNEPLTATSSGPLVAGKEFNEAVSKDTFNQQKITVNNTASKFTCGPSTVIGTNSEVYKTVQIGTQCWLKQDVKGGLYTWAAALRLPQGCDTSSCKVTTNQQGVCPSGWHIPTDMEFKTLRMFLGMSESDASQAIFGGTDQGTKLKVGGTSGFDAITDSGFNAFWTSSEDSVTKAWVLSLFTSETTIGRGTNNKTHPTSVRCLKN